MGFLSGIFKARDKPSNATAGSAYRFLFGGSTSGKAVTERSAMQMTAVYSCVRILAEAVAGLPLHLYRYTDTGGKEKAIDHPLYVLLHDEPNPEMTYFVFRETLMTHLLLWGNAYAQIIRNGKGEVVALYPLMPNRMVVDRDENGHLYDRACVHGFIDGNDGTIYQTLPWNHRGWHGGGSSNNTHIGVEMCEPACIKYTGGATFTCSDTATAKAVAKRTYEAAVELFAYLCKEYSLDPTADGVIVSHAEGYKRGIASNHGDPEHLWKQLNTGYTMDGSRKAVKAAMGTETAQPENNTTVYPEKLTSGYYRVRRAWTDSKSQLGAYRVLANAKAKADENTGYSVFDNEGNVVYAPSATKTETKTEIASFEPYRVRIGIANLNIRKGPGTNYGKTGQFTGVGVFTIIAESDGEGATKWGKLKSGVGWISLDYAKII